MAIKDSTFITRVILKNYKSIASCDVRLGPLMFLVGPNGAGKSNFLDALRFVADALDSSLDHALRSRGGINDVRRRSRGHPNHFSIRLEFTLPEGITGYYAFRIGCRPRGGYAVQTEECRVQEEYFRVDKGTVTKTSMQVAPAAAPDRLYLVNASGLPEFRKVYDALSRMGFYNLNLDKIRELQTPDLGDILKNDGSNLTSVFRQLPPSVKQNVEEYLALVVRGVRGVEVKKIGAKETLAFRQDTAGAKHPWRFLANNMSDGTLHILGTLVALLQENHDAQKPVPLIGIEEPEIALHPLATGVLLDSLRQAANTTQVLITSHSPELLNNKDLKAESFIAVEASEGITSIGPVDEVTRSVLKDRLFTIGQLLSMMQLPPDPTHVFPVEKVRQLRLFQYK